MQIVVPFLDLSKVHRELKRGLLDDISRLVDGGTFVNGPQVAAFESLFARYCGTRFCVGVASGLDALRLALLAAGIRDGDEVIVPANTFVATFEAVVQAGGVPVVVDASERDYNIDVRQAQDAITARTAFVVPVHLYGQMADMRAIRRVAGRARVKVIEDACQAHGAERDGIRAGAAGLAAAFSFYPGKNLGAMGDAGAVATNDEALASRTRALREHGQARKHEHDLEGYTARLDTIQAVVLLRKLPDLDRWNEQRRAAAAFYTHALAGIGDLRVPPVASGSSPVWHLYPVRSGTAARLAEFLAGRGIATGRHYPQPPHLARAYSWLGHVPGDFPVAETLSRELLSLPIFPGISEEQLQTVVAAVADFFRDG